MNKEQTPLMKQYWSVKSLYPEPLLFFRMGDFYELFFDDAVKAAPIAGLTLTSRNKKSLDETPMCGFPHHSAAPIVNKLLAQGLKVAICDQIEDPKLAKGLVKRAVTRVLTPGMVFDTEQLDSSQLNWLAAYDSDNLFCIDVSTGDFLRWAVSDNIESMIEILAIREVVVTESQRQALSKSLAVTVSVVSDPVPEASARLTNYVQSLGLSDLKLKTLKVVDEISRLQLSASAQKHLDLSPGLFHAIHRCRTPMGSRELRTRLLFPYADQKKLNELWDRLESWRGRPDLLQSYRESLLRVGDLERRLHKLSWKGVSPRDVKALEQSLEALAEIFEIATPFASENIPDASVCEIKSLLAKVQRTLLDEVATQFEQGGVIRPQFSQSLAEAVDFSKQGQKKLAEFELREKASTGISSLKLRFNHIFGYSIEITNTHKEKIPEHYIRKQTLATAERFSTPELFELEQKILGAETLRVSLEKKIFFDLVSDILNQSSLLLQVSQFIAEIDVVTGFAQLATERACVRPVIVDSQLNIKAGRHPVLEAKPGFIKNDLQLNSGDCLLLTGPNMAGKSTLMRQTALLVILAQMGAYVPAEIMQFPLFDQILTRIGAQDLQNEGLSTFMVEMQETSEILQQANRKSLVILDEVGRGTSTFDGMSLAQAILEHLVTHNRSYCFFATHYHELTKLDQRHSQIRNAHMAIQETQGRIQFLFLLRAGPALKSYGINVAQLANLPPSLVRRASELLREKEKFTEIAPEILPVKKTSAQLELDPYDSVVREILDLKVEGVTPLQALNKIQLWQEQFRASLS
jgi:DNA mismatch repair protein MutS